MNVKKLHPLIEMFLDKYYFHMKEVKVLHYHNRIKTIRVKIILRAKYFCSIVQGWEVNPLMF